MPDISDSGIALDQGVLINYGYIDRLWAENAAVINYGTIGDVVSERNTENPAGIWICGATNILNYGSLKLDGVSRLWDESYLINLNSITAYDFYLMGREMVNLGSISVQRTPYPLGEEEKGHFTVSAGSRFYNYGRFRTAEMTLSSNWGWSLNAGTGSMIIEDGSVFENAVIRNDGYFELESESCLMESGSGVFYGSGECSMAGADALWYLVPEDMQKIPAGAAYLLAGEDPEPLPEGAVRIQTEEELYTALQDDSVPAVVIGNWEFSDSLTVEKPLYIRGQLQFTPEGELVMKNAPVIFCYDEYKQLYNPSLSCAKITLDGSCVRLCEGAVLGLGYTQGAVPTLSLQNGSFIVGEDGGVLQNSSASPARISLTGGSSIVMRDGSCALDSGSLSLSGGSTFSTPFTDRMTASGTSFELSDGGRLCIGSGLKLDNGSILIRSGGSIYSWGSDLEMTDSRLELEEGAADFFRMTDIRLLGDSGLTNSGTLSVEGWDEHELQCEGQIENYGTLDLWVIDITLNPEHPIENYGSIWTKGEQEGLIVNGNPPHYQS